MPFAAALPSPLGPRPHSAVIVSVPEAEPVVGHHRRAFDESAPWGVPARVTGVSLHEPRRARRRRARCSERSRRCRVRRAMVGSTAWFDDKVLWLAPDPGRAVPGRSRRPWPPRSRAPAAWRRPRRGRPAPDGGAGRRPQTLRAVERQVQPALPVQKRVTEVQVIVGRPEVGGSWDVIARFPLSLTAAGMPPAGSASRCGAPPHFPPPLPAPLPGHV